jgi:hypothetical protein
MKRSDFASDEEYQIFLWLVEAENIGLVKGWMYESRSFSLITKATRPHFVKLKTKIREEQKHLLNGHSYKPDFNFLGVRAHPLAKMLAGAILVSYDGMFWTDVKGTFNPHGGDRVFSINQKLVYNRYKIYVNKVIPEKFFKKTWVPKDVAFGVSGKRLKKFKGCKLLSELL